MALVVYVVGIVGATVGAYLVIKAAWARRTYPSHSDWFIVAVGFCIVVWIIAFELARLFL